MDADSLLSTGAFELAHALPDRVRLRWRGAGEPPPALLDQLGAHPGVGRVDYRPASRSVVVRREAGDGGAVPPPVPRRSLTRAALRQPVQRATLPNGPRESIPVGPLDLD